MAVSMSFALLQNGTLMLPMLGKLNKLFREFGALDGLLFLFSRLLSRINKRIRLIKYYVYCQPVSSTTFAGKRRFTNINIFEITPDERGYRGDFPPRPDKVIDDRFAQSARCIVAYKHEEFTGFLWFVADQYMEDEIRCRYILHPKGVAVWDFDVYVTPKARFGGTFLKLWQNTFEMLENENISWTVSRISAFNGNSLRSHEKLGAINVGSVSALCVSSVQILFTTFRPYFSISIRTQPDIIIQVQEEDR